eukprot:3800193-Amphidinium_carterae.1
MRRQPPTGQHELPRGSRGTDRSHPSTAHQQRSRGKGNERTKEQKGCAPQNRGALQGCPSYGSCQNPHAPRSTWLHQCSIIVYETSAFASTLWTTTAIYSPAPQIAQHALSDAWKQRTSVSTVRVGLQP